jgi:hypothetical protein
VKVNPDISGAGTTDYSTFQCSHIELTDTGRPYIRDNCYTGGIDMHAATGWVVWRNRIEGFWCNDGLSEHGIHFWRGCVDTIVEENVVLDCARGIGFGLGSSMSDGHIGGIIRNNFVAANDSGLFASPDGFDTGIGLESASGTEVYHNTVVSTQAPVSSSIEWRWPNTVVEIANNLVSHDLVPRDGATATLTTNIDSAPLAWFADPATGDLHLVADGSAPVGAATPLAPGLCDGDIDGQARDFEPDVGADEFGQCLFADGFESGDTTMWTNVVP